MTYIIGGNDPKKNENKDERYVYIHTNIGCAGIHYLIFTRDDFPHTALCGKSITDTGCMNTQQ